jgi:hypothetical protein
MLHLPVIDLIREGEQLRVRSPYHPAFREGARELGGKWDRDREEWLFDPRLEQEVRALLTRIYGWDGTYPVLIADVRVSLDGLPDKWREARSLWLLGRELAYRPGRDARVRLVPGVKLEAGGFPPSGGSRKYPALEWKPGTVLKVFDVPVARIDALRAKYPEAIEEIPGTRRVVQGPGQVVPAPDPAKAAREVGRRILIPGEGG